MIYLLVHVLRPRFWRDVVGMRYEPITPQSCAAMEKLFGISVEPNIVEEIPVLGPSKASILGIRIPVTLAKRLIANV